MYMFNISYLVKEKYSIPDVLISYHRRDWISSKKFLIVKSFLIFCYIH